MTRLSQYFLPTEKQAPADAEALSHKLMVRAGLIRQLGAGMWSWLPAGWRVHENVAQIIREELNAIGGQEVLMPVLNPAEIWQRSGRYEIPELFKLHDRRGAELVLAMTHEEAVTTHVAPAVRSYRDLPFSLYHFQVKERDEPRPRAGVLRTREFIMKDAYTFDRDRAGSRRALRALPRGVRPHLRPRRDRVVPRRVRRRDDGRRRRPRVHGALAGGGERRRARARLRRQRRGRDRRRQAGRAAGWPVRARARRRRPGSPPSPRSRSRCTRRPGALLKAYPVIVEDRGLLMVVVRGDHRVNDIKLANALGAPFRPAREEEFAERIGPAGFIGPVNIDVPILLDDAVEPGAYISGANRDNAHLRGVEPGRDFPFKRGDVRSVEPGDTVNGNPIRIEPAIEIGNIFKLGTRYSEKLGATLPGRERQVAADLDGLLRARARAHHRRRGRAVRRRERHLVAARDRPVRHPPRRPRQGRQRRARTSPSASTASCREPD